MRFVFGASPRHCSNINSGQRGELQSASPLSFRNLKPEPLRVRYQPLRSHVGFHGRDSVRLVTYLLLSLSFLGVERTFGQGMPLERCNAKHVQQERFRLPSTSQAAHLATAAVVSKLVAAAGWTPEVLYSGVVLDGSITYPSGEKRTVRIYYKGRRSLRMEESTSAGSRVLVVNGLSAFITTNGKTVGTSPDTLREEHSYLPFLSDMITPVAHLKLTSVSSVEEAGTQFSSFRSVHFSGNRVGPFPLPASQTSNGLPEPDGFLYRLSGRPSESEFFLDPTTLLPSEIRSCSPLADNSNASVEVVRNFSGYTSVNGFVYPTHIEQTLGGGKPILIEVTSLKVDQHLSNQLWSTQSSQ